MAGEDMGLLDPEKPKKRWNNAFLFKKSDTPRVYHDDHERMTEEQRLAELNNLGRTTEDMSENYKQPDS
jgi:hypothetical protein